MSTIFSLSRAGYKNQHLFPTVTTASRKQAISGIKLVQKELLRKDSPKLPCVSELQVVRHYTKLSQKNFSITTHLYPLGSCTMKYNPWVCHTTASLPAFLNSHPETPFSHLQGTLQLMHDLQEMLKSISGMSDCSLAPMAGAQGELAGMLMIKKYLQHKKLTHKNKVLVPTSAHGTNPATAIMCGFDVVEVKSDDKGNVDIKDLKNKISDDTAGIMLTNPSTFGLYETGIVEIAKLIHNAGGLLYYDGANLNALLGKVRPGDIGFDVMHTNLHKTFATPHGGGGPGSGPVLCNKKLAPFLPKPTIQKTKNKYQLHSPIHTIGRMSAAHGNIGVLIRAYSYLRLIGKENLARVSEYSVLNANYLLHSLQKIGYQPAFPARKAAHEFIITLENEHKTHGISAMHVAKNLLDANIHPPTTYFPLEIPECLLFEPTETESKSELDTLIAVMKTFKKQMVENPNLFKSAPHKQPTTRLDDVKAAHPRHLTIREPIA